MTQIRIGQTLLIVCCIFYLIWWGVAFHPSHGNSHASGVDGVLLLVTAGFGLAGLAVNLIGIRDNAIGKGLVSGYVIIACGVLTYFLLMFGSSMILHRQVTTELMLIIGWAMLETASANTVFSLERMTFGQVRVFLAIITLAAISSLFFYLQYYRVEPMIGYYYGMVPLVTEGLSMAAFLYLTK